METFGYIRATQINEAVFLLNELAIKSRTLAGSTDLILIKKDTTFCERVMDISHIPELHGIKQENGWGHNRVCYHLSRGD